jgi:hypothetical protein
LCDIGAGANFLQNGSYRVSWKGNGTVGFNPSSASILWYSAQSKSAEIELHVPGGQGLNVRILRTSSLDPLHSLSIVPTASASASASALQVFQPAFLKVLAPFSALRFTGWQKITAGGNSKSWALRTTPASQTQHRDDGVALEHMLDLVRELPQLSAVWFSFPRQSIDYTKNALALIFAGLPSDRPGLKVYIEPGSPEASGDSDRHEDALQLFDAADLAFSSLSTQQKENLIVVPSISIMKIAFIAYIPTWYSFTPA